MSKIIDPVFLSSVWTRINNAISEQGTNKTEVAKRCGFDRKTLSSYGNLNLTYFARLCEELNVSADYFLFGLNNGMLIYNGNTMLANNKCGTLAQKELMTLADDFGILQREEVQEIIENCKSYTEGQQKLMEVYTAVYMN